MDGDLIDAFLAAVYGIVSQLCSNFLRVLCKCEMKAIGKPFIQTKLYRVELVRGDVV